MASIKMTDGDWTTKMPHKYGKKTSQDSALKWHNTILCSIIHIIWSKFYNYSGILQNPQKFHQQKDILLPEFRIFIAC
jgi:hypothetical protein